MVIDPGNFTYNDELPTNVRHQKNDKYSFFSGITFHTASFTVFMARVMPDYHPVRKKGFYNCRWVLSYQSSGNCCIFASKSWQTFFDKCDFGYICRNFHWYFIHNYIN